MNYVLSGLDVTDDTAETLGIDLGGSPKADEGSAIAFTVYPFGRVTVIVYPFSKRSPFKDLKTTISQFFEPFLEV